MPSPPLPEVAEVPVEQVPPPEPREPGNPSPSAAFRTCGVTRIHNDFELSRHEFSAWQTHRAVGFKEFAVQDGFLQMILTREEYLNNM